jgi:hypothetical protein
MSLGAALAAMALLTSSPPSSSPTKTSSSASSSSVIAGTYENERGSVLVLHSDGTGRLTGTFSSGVGAVDKAARFDVVGVENGDVVGFVVSFGGASSVGAWTGQLMGDELHLLWHLAKNVEDADEKMGLWSSIRTNADIFRRRQAPSTTSPSPTSPTPPPPTPSTTPSTPTRPKRP